MTDTLHPMPVTHPSLFMRIKNRMDTIFLRENLSKRFGVTVALTSFLLGIVTYALLTDDLSESDTSGKFYWILALDILLLLTLTYVVAGRVRDVWRQRLQHTAGAHLHTQLMIVFSSLVAVPAIFVTIFAVVFIHYGVQSWFGETIRTAVSESQEVAQAYLKEHQQSIRADLLAMAGDMNRVAPRLMQNKEALEEFFQTQAYLRNLSEAILLDGNGKTLARAGLSFSIEFLPTNFSDYMKQADEGQVVLLKGDNDDRVRALVKLDNFIDSYLFVGRFVDENVLARISATDRAASVYDSLQARQTSFKISMTLIFLLVMLMLLLVAIWASLTLAERIIQPVSRLIQAAERVRAGDLNARVEVGGTENEVAVLARAFNRMTDQLGAQRRDLLNANIQLDERRRFIETVLGGVNAGILAMDGKGVIQITNASALRLLKQNPQDVHGKKLADISPDMEKVRRALRSKPGRSIEVPIDVALAGQDQPSHWIIRMTAEGEEKEGEELRGYVATFDDLSPLIDAQRKAAWSDVARRVAHEIKNPLTPIQLSAERIKRRYGKQVTEDLETFQTCIDTIIRSVDDIRHMVDEFSNFARMPEASRREENIVTLGQQVMVLFQQGHQNVAFRFNRPDAPIRVIVDRQQITQALTNLVKNAYEAIKDTHPDGTGEVVLEMHATDAGVTIDVCDNGLGWPAELRDRLTDAYVTTKSTGTGLGLAIVAKIIEDHSGTIEFLDNTPSGAIVRVHIPKGETQHG